LKGLSPWLLRRLLMHVYRQITAIDEEVRIEDEPGVAASILEGLVEWEATRRLRFDRAEMDRRNHTPKANLLNQVIISPPSTGNLFYRLKGP
jgi:hypothetical protein